MKNKYSQKEIILKYLNWKQDWIPSYELVKKDTEWGYLGSSADRRARELYEEGKIDRRIIKKYAEYHCKQGEITIPIFVDNRQTLNFNQSIG